RNSTRAASSIALSPPRARASNDGKRQGRLLAVIPSASEGSRLDPPAVQHDFVALRRSKPMTSNERRHEAKAVSTATVLTAALVLWTASGFAAAPAKQVVGYATHTARVLPLWLAGEQKLFLKNGIDIEPVFIRGAPTLVAGLAAGSIQLGRTGGPATLGAASAGHDFKIVATFSSRNTYDLVVRPNIKRAEDIRGQTFAVTSIGGTSRMGVLLWLEHLGLDQQRDNIRFQVIGDQAVQVQCVLNGLCDAAAVDGVFSKQLRQKGMTILGEYTELKAPLVSQAVVVPGAQLQQRPEIAENYIKGEIEALAFSLAPKN